MLSREEMVAWVAIRYGATHAERRTTDGGFAYWIDTQPDAYLEGHDDAMTYGNGPIVVVKATGAAWYLASNPASMVVLHARSEAELKQLLREASYNPDAPNEIMGENRD